jgi:hypothetical protein
MVVTVFRDIEEATVDIDIELRALEDAGDLGVLKLGFGTLVSEFVGGGTGLRLIDVILANDLGLLSGIWMLSLLPAFATVECGRLVLECVELLTLLS